MSLPPTDLPGLVNVINGVADDIRRGVERTTNYSGAAAAAAIGAEYEQVHLLVEQLLNELETVPTATSVKNVTGASSSAAATFAVPLAATALTAGKATTKLRHNLEETMAAVKLTLDELSASDAEARSKLRALSSEVEATTGPDPVTAAGAGGGARSPGTSSPAPASTTTAPLGSTTQVRQ